MSDFLAELIAIIADRKRYPREGSYTNTLLSDPVRAAQKVGEEANELVVAALAQSEREVIAEMADLIYHSLVLLATRDLSWQEVIAELERRHRL